MTASNGSDAIFFTISGELKRVDEVLDESVHASVVPLIKEVASHIISSGGKRLRPALTILSAKICGYSAEKIPYLASAVELIHTASLIHDDVLDNADLRRGVVTANAKWGNHLSILVGDYCLGLANQLLVRHTTKEIIGVLTDAARETTEGEILEVVYSNDTSMGVDTYMDIINRKTARLIAASCEAGSMLAEAPQRLVSSLKDYGTNLGTAFQIVDDILDFTTESASLGKRRGTDLKEGKLTLPIIYALQSSNPSEKEIIKGSLLAPTHSEEDFRAVVNILDKYGCAGQAMETAVGFIKRSIESLTPFKQSLEKESLIKFANFVVTRRC